MGVQVAEKHGSLKVVVYEGLKWHHRQAQEDSRLNKKKRPPNRNKAAVSHTPHVPTSAGHVHCTTQAAAPIWPPTLQACGAQSNLLDMLRLCLSTIPEADQSSLWYSHQSVVSSVSACCINRPCNATLEGVTCPASTKWVTSCPRIIWHRLVMSSTPVHPNNEESLAGSKHYLAYPFCCFCFFCLSFPLFLV